MAVRRGDGGEEGRWRLTAVPARGGGELGPRCRLPVHGAGGVPAGPAHPFS